MDWSYLIQAGKEGFRENVWVHNCATVGTTVGVAVNTSPSSFTSTEAMLTIDNTADINGSAGQNVWVIPVSIDLTVVEGSTGTFWAVRLSLDGATSYSSGGTTLSAALTAFDTRTSWTARSPYARCAFGDLTLGSGTTSRALLGDWPISIGSSALTVGSNIRLNFGASGGDSSIKDRTSGTAAVVGIADVTVELPLIWIGRKSSLIVQPFASTATDLDFSVRVTCVELGHPRNAT